MVNTKTKIYISKTVYINGFLNQYI